jgi:hypothetical protein
MRGKPRLGNRSTRDDTAVTMNIDDAFPSRYLKPADLGQAAPAVVIAGVRLERVGSRQTSKPVLYFEGKSKGLILNKTNARAIAALVGTTETERWRGARVRLFVTTTTFGGETVPCIRVKSATAPAAVVDIRSRSDAG